MRDICNLSSQALKVVSFNISLKLASVQKGNQILDRISDQPKAHLEKFSYAPVPDLKPHVLNSFHLFRFSGNQQFFEVTYSSFGYLTVSSCKKILDRTNKNFIHH